MKPLFLFIFLAIAGSSFGQRNLTGLWTGSLTHDSLVGRKDLSFELALTQYKQKVYGYTRRTFIVNDTLYYVLKRVQGKIDGNVCEITDEEYISYNFQGQVDKNVKVTYTFRYTESDSTWNMNGEWKTNKVRRNFRAMTGSISVQQEKDYDNAKIFAHLEELKLADDVAFYQESKKPVVKSPPPTAVASNNNKTAKPQEPKKDIAKNDKPVSISTTTDNNKKQNIPQEQTSVVNKPVEKQTAPTPVPNNQKKEEVVLSKKQEETAITTPKSVTLTTQPEQTGLTASKDENNKPQSNASAKIETPVAEKTKATPVPATPEIKLPIAAAEVAERKTAPPQVVDFKSDSIELSLYDNGEVDGDTVSVLLNDEVIIAKQGLKASAFKKTIYFSRGSDEFKMILYAENLGKYPPNTGLLIIHDGEDIHQVRFSADLQQNAVLIFRRKK